MGNFSNNSITDVGKMLLADVQAGAVFTPTRIVIGSGSMPSGATTHGMTDVITPVKSLVINKKKRTPDGKCVFGGVFTNEEVTAPFYFRELALYAKAVYRNEDGSVKSETAETLYSYGNAGATADYMPAYSTATVVEKQMDLIVWIGNDAQVDLTVESGIYVNKSGDELTGWLTFKNYNDYFAIAKGRTLADGKTHFLTVGTGADGCTTIEHYTCDTEEFDATKRNGRLELNPLVIDGNLNSDALILRGLLSNNRAYRIYGDHYSPAVVATAELV